MYIIRLDDASKYMDVNNWNRLENLLDKYNIKPIVGIIPNNKDESLLKYKKDNNFWNKAKKWQEKSWTIALHGYEHKYVTKEGGINPVQKRSEFAGLNLNEQEKKIDLGYKILKSKNISPNIFFAPSHTFDNNTLIALKNKTPIRIISDTVANDIYYDKEFYFIPQQTGKVRNLPFKITTCCYHPNEMKEKDFEELEKFIIKNKNKFLSYNNLKFSKRRKSIYDKILSLTYYLKRRIKQ